MAAVADPLPLDQVCRFRIRSMISEQFIQTALYSSRKGHDEHRPSPPLLDLLACGSLANVSTLTTDFSLLVSLPNTKDTASTAANGNNDNNGKIDHMDEDYDDDMDASPTATLSQPQPPPAIPAVTATHIPSLHLPEHMLDPDLVPIDDVYHCLDEFVQVPLPRNELYERLNESPLTAVQQHPSTTTVLASCTNTSHHTDQQTCAGAGGGDGDLKKSFDENNGQASAINAAVAAPTTEDALNNSMSEGSPKVSSPNTVKQKIEMVWNGIFSRHSTPLSH